MWRIVGLVVVGLVAANAGIGCRVVISVVTVVAIVCNGNVGACQHVIIVVNGEGCRCPVWIGGMTGIAG